MMHPAAMSSRDVDLFWPCAPYSPLVGWIAKDARVAMAPSMHSNSLVASGSRMTSFALSTLHSLCAIVAAQSSATTETIWFVLPPHTHQGQAGPTLSANGKRRSRIDAAHGNMPSSANTARELATMINATMENTGGDTSSERG